MHLPDIANRSWLYIQINYSHRDRISCIDYCECFDPQRTPSSRRRLFALCDWKYPSGTLWSNFIYTIFLNRQLNRNNNLSHTRTNKCAVMWSIKLQINNNKIEKILSNNARSTDSTGKDLLRDVPRDFAMFCCNRIVWVCNRGWGFSAV